MAADQYSKLHLDFTDDGTLKVITDGTVSLQKQVRALRQELSVAAPEQQQQIRMALAQAELGLEKTKAQSKELFGQLALLPGPMGRFASEAQMGYLALRTLSQLSFKDIITDLKIMGQTLFGIQNPTELFYGKGATLGNSSGGNGTANALAAGGAAGVGAGTVLGGGVKGSGASQTGGVIQSIGGNAEFNKQYQEFLEINSKVEVEAEKALQYEKAITGEQMNISSARLTQLQKEGAVYYENLVKYQKATDAYGESFAANKQLVSAAERLTSQFSDLGVVIDNGTLKIARNDEALRALSKDELAAVNSGKKLILTEEGLIVATTAFGTALRSLGAIFAGILTTLAELLPLLLVIAGIMKGGEIFIEWITGAKAAEVANNKLIESMKGLQERLELNAATEKNTAEKRLANLKANLTDERSLREQNIKDTKEQLGILEKSIAESVTNQNQAIKNLDKFSYTIDDAGKYKTTKFFGIGQEQIDKAVKSLEDANKQVAGLYIKRGETIANINKLQGDNTSTIRKNKEQDDLRELDATIQKEINSEETQSKNLLELYKKRNDMIDKENRRRNVYLQDEEARQRAKQQAKTALEEEVKDKVAALDRLIQVQKNAELETTKGTEEYFAARREQIALEFSKESEQARTSEKHKDELVTAARAKNYKANFDLDKEELTARIEMANLAFENEAKDTAEAFNKRRNIENAEYALRQKDAQLNYNKLQELAEQHKNKMGDIDDEEMAYKASIEKRKSDTEQENFEKADGRFIKSYRTIVKMNERKFDDLREEEQYNYEVSRDNAEGNTKELEEIEKEHAARMRQLKAQEFETNKQLDLMTLQATQAIGTDISSVGDALMQAKQGRDKKAFESGKQLAVAGIVIEKASAIGQIWENNAIANAKAIAAFPLTLGQPWVTLNTVQAAFGTAATVASAATAISQINGTDFQQATFSGRGLGKNYGMGGMIEGKSHSQGGVPINAEGGEAIMSRGAVTMFAPLLSLMNQAGGGTAFSQGAMGGARYDAPKAVGGTMEQPIIKTYVVEGDMTTMQHKAARLKSLSTL